MSHPLVQCLAKCGKGSVAPLLHRKETSMFDLLETWKESGSEVWKSQTLQVDARGLDHRMHNKLAGNESFTLRIVFIPLLRLPDRICLDLQEEQFEQVIDLFGLRQIHELAHTSPMTFDVIPKHQDGNLVGLECSVFISRFFGIYATHQSHRTTHGIVWGSKRMLDHLRVATMDLIDKAEHPLYLLLSTMITLTLHIDHELTDIHSEVRSVEGRTGYHQWGETIIDTAPGSFAKLSAQMSGRATTLASIRRMTKLSCEMLAIVEKPIQLAGTHAASMIPQCQPDPIFLIILDRRFRNQLLQLDLIEARVHNQLTALFNLVTSQETNQNLEIAKDSRTIANATRRDSSSMKILAAVTVFFLPATFIASLFSTSMFDWHVADGHVVSTRFWIYWATVIPLTLLTMAICFLLSRRWANLAQCEDNHAAEDLSKSVGADKRDIFIFQGQC